MNCLLVETEEDILVIDAGLMFPEEEMLGVDLVIPNFAYLLEHREKVRGVILTHGHEDHTGALPFLLHDLEAPVYSTQLSLGLVRERLKEFDLLKAADLRVVRPGDRVSLGSLEVECIRVCHSIPDGIAVAIETGAGLILHTGDFKLDQTPVDGHLTDYRRLAELGEKGILVLLSDSTNANRPGFTPSERIVGTAFETIFRQARGKVIVACFASNIHRIQQVLDVAAGLGRKVAVTGKSMVANVRIAQELGYLQVQEETLVQLHELNRYPPHHWIILTTGSQGEPLSAIARMAQGEHTKLHIQPGDTVIFSARVIPGHEKAIARTVNQFFKGGAEVIADEADGVHASGHASQEELKLMLNLTRPRFFIPIHGERRHLCLHARLAEEVGLPRERIFVAEDGDVLEFRPLSGKFIGKVGAGYAFIDEKARSVGREVLRDRQRLAQAGLLLVTLAIEQRTGRIIAGPEIATKGFIGDSVVLSDEVKGLVQATLVDLGEGADRVLIEQRIRDVLRKFFRRIKRRPMILPVLVEVKPEAERLSRIAYWHEP